MSQRYLGGIITANQNTTNSGLYTPALGAATPGVWTLSQANKAAAQRSWNMYDPYFPATTGVVHGIGTNGGTNDTFLDSSDNNFTVTRNGNVTQGTFNPFSKPNGYWSNYFDGTVEYITVNGDSNLAFGSNNFTIECFFHVRIVNTNAVIYDCRTVSTATLAPVILIDGNYLIQFVVNGANRITSSRVDSNRWYHLVVSRLDGTTRMFLDGVPTGNVYIDTNVYINNANRPYIGTQGYGTPAFAFDGYISNLRVLNGTGTDAPTVPTLPLEPIPDTQLLICQSNRIVDNSPNEFTLTKTSDIRVMEYSPFYYPYAYDPTVNGGGMFFDGSGDYLDLTGSSNLAFGTNNFTIELFLYINVLGTFMNFYDSRPAGTNGAYPTIYKHSDNSIRYYANTGERIIGPFLVPGTWYHVVVSRVSDVTRMFVNGVEQATTYADTTTYLNGASRPRIGANGTDAAASVNGFVSNVRVLNGTGVTSVTVPTAPYTPEEDANTQLLLSGTNAAIFDNASNLTIETINASISTANSKFGGSSIYFNGTNALARIRTPILGTNISYALPLQGNFTVECWFNLTSIAPAASSIICLNSNTASYAALRINVYSNGQLTLLASTSGSAHTINTGTATGLITANNWFHLAVVRQQGSFLVYVNGIQRINSTTIAATTSLMNGTENFLGGINNGGYQLFMPGYINDFRITNYARYLGQFTPPTSTLQNQ